jgi:hypothetical protein
VLLFFIPNFFALPMVALAKVVIPNVALAKGALAKVHLAKIDLVKVALDKLALSIVTIPKFNLPNFTYFSLELSPTTNHRLNPINSKVKKGFRLKVYHRCFIFFKSEQVAPYFVCIFSVLNTVQLQRLESR